MNKLILIAIVGTITACQAGPDESICTAIIEPMTPVDAEDSVRLQSNGDWVRTRAEACVHRQAYRLAASSDPAETVAKAALEACEAEVGAAVALMHGRTYDGTAGLNRELRLESAKLYADRAADSYKSLALLKVVEGRAGNCRG